MSLKISNLGSEAHLLGVTELKYRNALHYVKHAGGLLGKSKVLKDATEIPTGCQSKYDGIQIISLATEEQAHGEQHFGLLEKS